MKVVKARPQASLTNDRDCGLLPAEGAPRLDLLPHRPTVRPQTIAACGRGVMGSNSALFIGWKLPVVGREADALELFGSFVGYLGKQQAAGAVDSFEPCLIAPHGGDLDGFILVRGERSKLSMMRFSEEFEELVSKCLVSVDGFGVVEAYVGESVTTQLQRYAKNIRR